MAERRLIGAMIHDREAWEMVHSKLERDDLTEQGHIIVEHITDH